MSTFSDQISTLRKRYAARGINLDIPCDRCGGSGEQSVMALSSGALLSLDTDGMSSDYGYGEDWITQKSPCGTCNGTGVMPEYLVRYATKR